VPPVRTGPPVVTASEGAAKETRLASEASAAPVADQIKQTRLAAEGNGSYAGGDSANAMFQAAAPMPPAAKSNAKLFIGIAAAALIAVVGIAAVMLSGGTKQSPAPNAPATQPLQSPAPSTAPSSGMSQPAMPLQQPPQSIPQASPVDGLAGAHLPQSDNANAPKGTKTARKESDAEAAARKEKARKAAEARRLLNQ
jgi:hypothetical protein